MRVKLDVYGCVKEEDLYDTGYTGSRQDDLEIVFAMNKYFDKYEFEQNLVWMRVSQLPVRHPEHSYTDNQWILLQRGNLDLRE